ncbi:hypothetical protein DUNSADRAFT_9678 [Dunaliella salina]|uniref:Encoded protein n=1 Tax=Dunaliella salina TaxID=3046 RepID=A0ABQ7GH03_DUNSA|nr:hypothetical protein DUNSADRAFT_9678 [Dunaliella salina]|eukprot:KAF5833883.1 hypothetical protein DUNSADRAFT_9678 [Dunaliella salina]
MTVSDLRPLTSRAEAALPRLRRCSLGCAWLVCVRCLNKGTSKKGSIPSSLLMMIQVSGCARTGCGDLDKEESIPLALRTRRRAALFPCWWYCRPTAVPTGGGDMERMLRKWRSLPTQHGQRGLAAQLRSLRLRRQTEAASSRQDETKS